VDTNFNAVVSGTVSSIALQPDGKVLVGGTFSSVSGVTRTNLCRLESNGIVDTNFIASATLSLGQNTMVTCVALQADGKILVAGNFTALDNQPRSRLGRLNADGSLDAGFTPGANSTVTSLALQADGRIIVSGAFTNLAGQARNRLGRLSADGSLDPYFNPSVNGLVSSLGLQADGAVLVGGSFSTLAGQMRTNVARLINPDAATQTPVSGDGALAWLRGGSSPEVWRVSLEASVDGTNWLALGEAAPVPGGWQLANVLLAPGAVVRARGYLSGGQNNGSSVFVQSEFTPPTLFDFGLQSGQFGFNLGGAAGQVVVIEASTNLATWLPLQTNLVPVSGFLPFSDPDSSRYPRRFYRAQAR
jgi:uncharacterized delta-60 repeat protein